MGQAQLKITYTKVASSPDYAMRTLIDSVESTPDVVDSCLVVRKGGSGADEYLARIATLTDLQPTPLSSLPSSVERFSSLALLSLLPGGLQNGDLIRIYNIPFMWNYFFGESNGSVAREVVDDNDPFDVVVDPVFPTFGRNLSFSVTRAGYVIVGQTTLPTDGLANRDFSSFPGELYFLTNEHYDQWASIDDADNKFYTLRGEAQALVTALNVDTYTGTIEELYT